MIEKNRIWSIEDLDSRAALDSIYDLGIFACGYEQRSTYVPSRIALEQCKERIVLAFEDIPDALAHKRNLEYYRSEWPAEIIYTSSNDDSKLYERLRAVAYRGATLRLLVDYTSMSRVWYNALLNWLHHTPGLPPIHAHFVYARGTYLGTYEPLQIVDVLALPGCEAEQRSDRRTFAIVGLGFDATVALGVLDRLEPNVVRAFYASPGSSPEDANRTLFTNQGFINEYASVSLALPLSSVEATVRALQEVITPELGRENIIFIPLGPKPHVLAAMLLARLYERDLSCLRVSGTRSPVDVVPTGEIVSTRIIWLPDSPRISGREQPITSGEPGLVRPHKPTGRATLYL